jgi:hypothetical protein
MPQSCSAKDLETVWYNQDQNKDLIMPYIIGDWRFYIRNMIRLVPLAGQINESEKLIKCDIV